MVGEAQKYVEEICIFLQLQSNGLTDKIALHDLYLLFGR